MQTTPNEALDDHAKVADEWVKYTLLTSGADWLPRVIDTAKDQIAKLQTIQDDLAKSTRYSIAPITSANPADTDGAQGSSNEVATFGSVLASPLFGITPPQDTPPTPSTSSGAGDSFWGMSAGASFGWGLWSAGGTYAHEQSDSDFKSAMASVDVSVSFAALVVNITRPWFYAELFNDYELDTATNALLSPGAEDLQKLIAKQGEDQTSLRTLAQYNAFPAFPTSFIVASDVVLEFTGKTRAIEQHFHSESNIASARFGWGPFSVGRSFHQASSRRSFTCRRRRRA